MSYKFDVALSFATEDNKTVKTIYEFLKSEKFKVFFAPECQEFLVGMNQNEVFYQVFANLAKYVILLISEKYILKDIPMLEANIAIANHKDDCSVIPVYLDETQLPISMWNPKEMNYFRSNNPAEITKIIKAFINNRSNKNTPSDVSQTKDEPLSIELVASGNIADKQQIFSNPIIYGGNHNG